VPAAAAVVLLAAFAIIAVGVDQGWFSEWDSRVLALVEEDHNAWTRIFWVMTLLGNTTSLIALGASAVLLLAAWGRRPCAFLLAFGMLSAGVASNLLKVFIGRERPPAAAALIELPTSGSLPSGHAFLTSAFLGLLVYVLFRGDAFGADARAARSWASTASGVAAIALATIAAALIGLSRTFLGVHWASDVLAGWAIGGAWLAIIVLVFRAWSRRRQLAAVHTPPISLRRRVVFGTLLALIDLGVIVMNALSDSLLAPPGT